MQRSAVTITLCLWSATAWAQETTEPPPPAPGGGATTDTSAPLPDTVTPPAHGFHGAGDRR